MREPLTEKKYTQVVSKEDSRLYVENIKYTGESGDILAHFARPKGNIKLPGVIVIHEIWGLVDHIKDVAQRLSLKGFLVLAPDALSPVGGTPDDVNEARSLIRKLDNQETVNSHINFGIRSK